jgi:IS66 Orf2 like protein
MLPPSVRIFVCTVPQDMRRSLNGLALATRQLLGQDPQSGAVFVFVNKCANRGPRSSGLSATAIACSASGCIAPSSACPLAPMARCYKSTVGWSAGKTGCSWATTMPARSMPRSCRYWTSASTRPGAPEPPAILSGTTITVAPRGGSAPRLGSSARPPPGRESTNLRANSDIDMSYRKSVLTTWTPGTVSVSSVARAAFDGGPASPDSVTVPLASARAWI